MLVHFFTTICLFFSSISLYARTTIPSEESSPKTTLAGVRCDQMDKAPNLTTYKTVACMCAPSTQCNEDAYDVYCYAQGCSEKSGCQQWCNRKSEYYEPAAKKSEFAHESFSTAKDLEKDPADLPKAKDPKSGAVKAKSNSETTQTKKSVDTGSKPSESSLTSSNDPDMDIRDCQQMLARTRQCCGSPASCVSGGTATSTGTSLAQIRAAGGSEESMLNYCRQLQTTGGLSTSTNANYGSVCYQTLSACQTTCNNFANQYSSRNPSVANTLSGIAQSCGSYSSQLSAIGQQGLQGGSAANDAAACQQMISTSSAQPQSLGLNNGYSSTGSGSSGTSCYGSNCDQQNSSPKESYGEAMFEGNGKKNDGSGFNLNSDGSTSDTNAWRNSLQSSSETTIKTLTVPNNSGGGIPGSAGQGTTTRPKPRQTPSPGSPGYTTDILQGTQGTGGYSAPVYGDQINDSGNGRRIGKNDGKTDDKGQLMGLDLKRYLPGGSHDPRRSLAGFRRRPEIRSKEDNIWLTISDKMMEKCKLGILIDCR